MSQEKKIADITQISVEGVALGVRFQPCYAVLDRVGEVVDRVLRTQGSPFDPNFFPLSNRETGKHSLHNTETGDQLILTHSDVILDDHVGSRRTSEIETLAENYATFVLKNLLDIARLKDIVRYAVLFRLQWGIGDALDYLD